LTTAVVLYARLPPSPYTSRHTSPPTTLTSYLSFGMHLCACITLRMTWSFSFLFLCFSGFRSNLANCRLAHRQHGWLVCFSKTSKIACFLLCCIHTPLDLILAVQSGFSTSIFTLPLLLPPFLILVRYVCQLGRRCVSVCSFLFVLYVCMYLVCSCTLTYSICALFTSLAETRGDVCTYSVHINTR